MNTNDLFDNPMVRNAIQKMTPEQREIYKKLGENFYKDIDFASYKPNVMPQELQEELAYIIEGLKAGLHPKSLNEGEIKLLVEAQGSFWYKNFGYETKDLSK